MAVADYGKREKIYKDKLIKTISKANKTQINLFLAQYKNKVSPARLCIFLAHIQKMLVHTPNFKRDMNNREKMNKLFAKLNEQYSKSYYGTIVNVSLRYARWLNKEDKPKGLKDISNIKKKEGKRKLSPKDMLLWDDGLKMCENTPSLMIKALVLTQLDGGFRPSEFENLKYGDVSKDGVNLIAHVTEGKTGERNVILWRCVPALKRWLLAHPSKQPKDPLWIQENNNQGKIIPYAYPAMRKRVLQLGEKAKIKKPLDFYNFRHSAAAQTKRDNFPTDLAASKFGHSEEYYVYTYGRLDSSEEADRVRKVYGISKSKEKTENPTKECINCQMINEPERKVCSNCGNPLSLNEALKQRKTQSKEIENIVMGLLEKKFNMTDVEKELKRRKG